MLEEDREALDAALEFENSCIQERQKRLNSKRSSNKPPNDEPDPLTAVVETIRTLSAREASELLIKYFDKVRSSSWTHIKTQPVAPLHSHATYTCFHLLLCMHSSVLLPMWVFLIVSIYYEVYKSTHFPNNFAFMPFRGTGFTMILCVNPSRLLVSERQCKICSCAVKSWSW